MFRGRPRGGGGPPRGPRPMRSRGGHPFYRGHHSGPPVRGPHPGPGPSGFQFEHRGRGFHQERGFSGRGRGGFNRAHFNDGAPPRGGYRGGRGFRGGGRSSQHLPDPFQEPQSREEPVQEQEQIPLQPVSNERQNDQPGPSNQTTNDRNVRQPPLQGEDEPYFNENNVILDWYNSDLNLKISPDDFCSAYPLSHQGFGYLWAGARATFGATRGKVCYEVRVDSNMPIDDLEDAQTAFVLRCGWSVDEASLQLGEDSLSFGFGGTAKISSDGQFRDYGRPFGVGDVIGCFLDMTSDPMVISFSVNGQHQGQAFQLSRHSLRDRALYPHVLTKNQGFSINFGQMPRPLANLLPGFAPIGQLDVQDGLVPATKAPSSRDACETLLMIGLPGAGKSYWAEQYRKAHPEKRFNILGTNSLIDRMKVSGLSRWRNYAGRWDMLIQKCTDCFSELVRIACTRRRNYILDQTNVFPTARIRKMKEFQGFRCKAIVVVPHDFEYRRRVAERDQREGKAVPDEAILNMKANFVLPEIEEDYASEVIYTELGPPEASKLVRQYNAEAEAQGIFMSSAVKNFVARALHRRSVLGLTEVIGKHESELGNASRVPEPSTTRPGAERKRRWDGDGDSRPLDQGPRNQKWSKRDRSQSRESFNNQRDRHSQEPRQHWNNRPFHRNSTDYPDDSRRDQRFDRNQHQQGSWNNFGSQEQWNRGRSEDNNWQQGRSNDFQEHRGGPFSSRGYADQRWAENQPRSRQSGRPNQAEAWNDPSFRNREGQNRGGPRPDEWPPSSSQTPGNWSGPPPRGPNALDHPGFPSHPSASASGNPPDYKALLQYLKFYQRQFGNNDGGPNHQ